VAPANRFDIRGRNQCEQSSCSSWAATASGISSQWVYPEASGTPTFDSGALVIGSEFSVGFAAQFRASLPVYATCGCANSARNNSAAGYTEKWLILLRLPRGSEGMKVTLTATSSPVCGEHGVWDESAATCRCQTGYEKRQSQCATSFDTQNLMQKYEYTCCEPCESTSNQPFLTCDDVYAAIPNITDTIDPTAKTSSNAVSLAVGPFENAYFSFYTPPAPRNRFLYNFHVRSTNGVIPSTAPFYAIHSCSHSCSTPQFTSARYDVGVASVDVSGTSVNMFFNPRKHVANHPYSSSNAPDTWEECVCDPSNITSAAIKQERWIFGTLSFKANVTMEAC